MDEEQREQIVCAIYMAIFIGNYKCANTILDEVLLQVTGKVLDQVIEIIENDGSSTLVNKVIELRHQLIYQSFDSIN